MSNRNLECTMTLRMRLWTSLTNVEALLWLLNCQTRCALVGLTTSQRRAWVSSLVRPCSLGIAVAMLRFEARFLKVYLSSALLSTCSWRSAYGWFLSLLRSYHQRKINQSNFSISKYTIQIFTPDNSLNKPTGILVMVKFSTLWSIYIGYRINK